MGVCVNKSELIATVAGRGGISKSDAVKAVDATIGSIVEALKNKDEVRLPGFGTFTVMRRNATQARNPRTGAMMKVPATAAPKFRPGKALKEAVSTT